MRGIAKYVTPDTIKRRLGRIRSDIPEIVAAKLHIKQGNYRQALALMVSVNAAEAGHLQGFDRWAREQPAPRIEDFV